MWWMIVFWILLFPLIIAEIVIFVKTKKVFWLIYALSIFIYVIAVSYMLDVFNASRNAIIATLVASSVLMAFIGRKFGTKVKAQKVMSRVMIIICAIVAGVLIFIFVGSAIFGVGKETVQPVSTISLDQVVQLSDGKGGPIGESGVKLLTRTIENSFFLPVPVQHYTWRACVETSIGTQELSVYEQTEQNPEVGPKATRSVPVSFSKMWISKDQRDVLGAKEIRVYQTDVFYSQYLPCEGLGEPNWRIPITP